MSSRRPPSWSLIVAALVAILAGCSDPTAETTSIKPSFATDAYCALYPHICTPSTPDEAPAAPGYYGGGAITDQYCAGNAGGINDADQDVLADDCELWLAKKFAPKMIYDRADDVRRESYWAVKPIKVGVVRVFYALGYYFDLGATADCDIPTLCTGHHGDSEHIVLDLRYNPSTKHWYLTSGKLSVHTSFVSLTPGPAGYPTTVTYPQTPGGYPQIFVARQKHGNYPSRASCNSGGALASDDCAPNDQSFWPEVIPGRNLGRSGRKLIDKVASTYPFYQSPVRYEYMWSSPYFYGWQQDRTTHATGYGSLLVNQGF